MTNKKQHLFSAFSPVPTDEWEAKIRSDLKGRDYNRTLIWHTIEGLDVRPYYRLEDLDHTVYTDSLPGVFPFTRGGRSHPGWLIRQNLFVQDFEEGNKKARKILEQGVTSLGFYFDCTAEIQCRQLDALLKDFTPDRCEINFVCPCRNCRCVEAFADFVYYRGWDIRRVHASSAFDPLAMLAVRGKFEEGSEEAAFEKLKEGVQRAAGIPGFRVIGVNGAFFGNSGASLVQELAFTLAQGAEYLIRLTEAGIAVDTLARTIKFNFSISGPYFLAIARLRAARYLWARIVESFHPKDKDAARMVMHCETAKTNKTLYDPYVNLLRTQTEAMAAILGGTDSLTVEPFDVLSGTSREFSERLARNQQILLKEEAHFDKTMDPGAGSYYIENLTDAFIREAWDLFLRVQDQGGFLKALRKGFVQGEIKRIVTERDKKYAFQKENLLGINQFPDISERLDPDINRLIFTPQDFTVEEAEVETLTPYQAARPFEELRYKTDAYAKKNKRPEVFILPLGNPTIRKARAQFSSNFFAVAGFNVIDNLGFQTVEEGIKALEKTQADLIVVCSSDEEYATLAPEIAKKIKSGILIIAGNPPARTELEKKGIANFIHRTSNLVEELKKYQELLKM
jgi:methylmalonyl-CoA mutase